MNVLDNRTYTAQESQTRAVLREIRNVLQMRESGVIYGFHVNSGESDPSAAVTYLADAVGMTPAAMDFTNDKFLWGSWRDAFFMPRPCMLKYDGTVDYYLNPDDYTKKADGTASDIADAAYGGNAMMEWGRDGRLIWYKIVPDTGDATSASVYVADHQADDEFVCWPFVNSDGETVEHFYTPIYNGSLDTSGRLRSLSGVAAADICQGKSATQEVAAAELNNPGTAKLWYIETFGDTMLMLILLILMGKSLHSQGVFGNGRINNGENMIGTGTMNGKGLFWGGSGNNDGVKVFGQENFWGNQWHRTAGLVMIDYTLKYKLTRGTEDGSEAMDYVVSNTSADYAGYKTAHTAPSTNNYVSAMQFNAEMFGPQAVDGSAATYWCDYWYQANGCRFALRGGSSNYSANAGAFFFNLGNTASVAYWSLGAAPSCKPLSREGELPA